MQHIKLTLTLMIFALLTGCASNVNVAKQLNEQNNLTPGEGVVVARIINASSYPFPINQIFIAPKDVNASSADSKFELAYSLDRPIGDSSLFAVTLPQGEYSISGVRSFASTGEVYYTRGVNLDPAFGTFTIKSGSVTDLGTMIFYPKSEGERYKDILARVPDTSNGELLTKYFPSYANLKPTLNTWLEDDETSEEDRFLTYASIAQNPISYTDTIKAPDGNIYFLGKLGVMLKYSDSVEFETLALDTNLELTSLDQNTAGVTVVGGHEGALFMTSDLIDWEAISIDKKATVYAIEFYSDNQFDVVYANQGILKIERFDIEDTSSRVVLNEYTFLNKWSNQDLTIDKDAKAKKQSPQARDIADVTLTGLGETNLITISYVKPNEWSLFGSFDTESFRYTKDDWLMMTPEADDDALDTIINAGVLDLGVKYPGFWSMTGRPTFYVGSGDFANWQKVSTKLAYCKEGELTPSKNCKVGEKFRPSKNDTFSFVSTPWFYSEQEGLAIVSFSNYNFWSGQSSRDVKILKTTNAGKTWDETDLSLPKEYCTSIVQQVSEGILIACEGATSDFYYSSDFGQSWENVRQQQVF